MIDVKEYIDEIGKSPYSVWFKHLEAIAAAKAYWKDYKVWKRKNR